MRSTKPMALEASLGSWDTSFTSGKDRGMLCNLKKILSGLQTRLDAFRLSFVVISPAAVELRKALQKFTLSLNN